MTTDELIKRFGAHKVGDALCKFSDADLWKNDGRTLSIPLNRILWEVWKPSRLTRCRELLAEGSHHPPPVQAVGFRIILYKRSTTLFSLGDGNHRCAAAAEAGKSLIRAKIDGSYVVDFMMFRLSRGLLYRIDGDHLKEVCDVPDDLMPIMNEFGVRAA